MNATQPNLENWDDFLGSWFKNDHVKSWPAETVVMNVKAEYDAEDNANLILELSYLGKKYKFQPNKTNIGIIREAGLASPKDLENKKLTFKSVMNFNPQLKKKVPSLEIDSIK